jgi:uncharacterized protein DUF4349
MQVRWGRFWQRSRTPLKKAWLLMAAVVAFYIGAVAPGERYRGISESKATGLGAVSGGELSRLWSAAPLPQEHAEYAGIVGGLAGVQSYVSPASSDAQIQKLVRTAALDLITQNPAETADQIRHLAERMGGSLVTSRVVDGQDSQYANITIRVPAVVLEEAREQIRKLAARVQDDRAETNDSTRDYVDRVARLRNLRAEETQYLAILKRAATVKDALEVSEKLGGVRGQIESQQAEFENLKRQVETAMIAVSLRAQEEERYFGLLQWRPVARLKLAAVMGAEGVAEYVASLVSFLFYLPTVLLWLGTILIGASVCWRILRWAARRMFGWPPAAEAKTA